MRTMRFNVHPVALVLLGASAILAAGTALVPLLAPWAARAGWVLAWGVVVAAAWLLLEPRPAPPARELLEVRAIRDALASRLRLAAVTHPDAVVFTTALAQAVARLDDEVLPALAELLERHAALGAWLARYERGKAPAPDADALERLRRLSRLQRRAIDETVRQAATAEALLVAIVHESADPNRLAEETVRWSDGLRTLHQSLAEVLHQGR